MAQWLRQGTAVKLMIGPAVATGGLAAVTTLKASTVTALRIRKHGATVVVTVTGRGLTHVSGGHYFVSLTSTDTNTLGHLRLYVRASGTAKSLPMWQDAHVVPSNVFDSLVSGGSKLNVGTLASAAVVWTAAGRTLSSGSSVWAAATRTLTSGGSAACSVWGKSIRVLTSGLSVACSVWGKTARTLTSAGVAWTAGSRRLSATGVDDIWDEATAAHTATTAFGGRILIADQRIWSYATRTLTAVGGGSLTASGVWTYTSRTLTDKVGYALTTAQHDAVGRRAWGASNGRTLTSAGVAWTAGTRTLTSAGAAWSAGTRTLTSAGVAWDATRANHLTAGSFGDLGKRIVHAGTLVSGQAGSVLLATSLPAVFNNQYRDMVIVLVSGTGAGQINLIRDFTGATRQAVLAKNWSTTPNSTTKYLIVAAGPAGIGRVLENNGTTDLENAIFDLDLTPSRSSHTVGQIIRQLGLAIESRTNGNDLNTLLGVTDAAGQTLVKQTASTAWTTGQARTLTSGGSVASSVWNKTITDVTGAPTSAAAGTKLAFIYVGARYKRLTTATGDKLHSSASAVIAKAPISRTSTVFTRGKFVTATA